MPPAHPSDPPRSYGTGDPAGPAGQGGTSPPGQPAPYTAPYGTSYAEPAPQYGTYGYPAPAPTVQRTNGKAITSFVLSLVGLLLVTFIPLILSVIAVIFGHIARKEINADPNQTGGGLAMAGLIIGWITIGLVVIVGLVILFVFSAILGAL